MSELLESVKDEKSVSMVPEGRESDFPNMVFNEQLMNALAQSVNIDLAQIRAMQKQSG